MLTKGEIKRMRDALAVAPKSDDARRMKAALVAVDYYERWEECVAELVAASGDREYGLECQYYGGEEEEEYTAYPSTLKAWR
jgi:hypothetical protein